jgi:FtsH-binding integral membrane protein
MKKAIVFTLLGIAMGCTIAVIVLLIGIAISGEAFFAMTGTEFTTHMMCGMLVGVGFVLPSLVYENERLAMWLRVLIHMGVGFVVFFITASYAGWIPVESGTGATILFIVMTIATSFLIWTVFYLYNKSIAKKINEQLKNKQSE